MKNSLKTRKGMALLMAVLVSGLFFVISAAIFKISLTELVLSSTERDSQYAFYAADSGTECALYWSYKYTGGDGTGDAFSIYNNGGPDEDSNRERLERGADPMISCGVGGMGQFRQGDFVGGGIHQTFFAFNYGASGCVNVVVSKFASKDPDLPANPNSNPIAKTTIVSRGYNTCNFNDPKRVERAIRVTIE